MLLAEVLAHPLVEADLLPVAPAAVAAAGAMLVVLFARFGPAQPFATRRGAPAADGPLSWCGAAGRTLAVGVLVGMILVGWMGPASPARNLAPLLVVGVGWPALVVASALLGPVWHHVDPFDGLARLLRAPGRETGFSPEAPAQGGAPRRAGRAREPPVWAAAAPALLLVWYVSAHAQALEPRRLGLALALYTALTVAACLALGRDRWLARGEVIGPFLAWVGALRRRGLATWQPPPGAAVVLGVLAGGLLFGAVRVSQLWTPVLFALGGPRADLVGVAGCSALGAALLGGLEAWARRRGAKGAPTAAAVPVVAGIAVAASLVHGRALLAAWLLPGVLLDPLGLGWAPAGLTGPRLDALPVGHVGVALTQLGLLVVAALAGATVVRGRAVSSRRGVPPALLAVIAPFVTAVLVVTAG